MNKNLIFIVQWVVTGLAIAFIILITMNGFPAKTQVVEFHEKSTSKVETTSNTATLAELRRGFSGAVSSAAPAVVYIYTSRIITRQTHPFMQDQVFREFFGSDTNLPSEQLETGLGSGVIISPQGYILTNYHVIAEADEIQVQLNDGRSVMAHIVGTDPETDLAVLQIALENLPVINIGQSSELQVGDLVLAIGNPFGVGQTVTMGIVSATGRDELGVTTFENFIQTDAAINPGNSGGALVNPDGELVGINTAVFAETRLGGPSAQGIGFAIPIALAKDIMQQIIAQGYVTRGWLGVEVQDINPRLAEALNLIAGQGALIRGVQKNGPADKAGLKSGDIILYIDGTKIHGAKHALNKIVNTRPNQTTQIKIMRGGNTLSLQTLPSLREIPAI